MVMVGEANMSIESGGYFGSNSAEEQPREIGFIRMDTQHKYRVSRDYKWLWQLCHETPIICIVSYLDCRDIACTLVYGDTVQVSARGISYIYASDEEDFIKQCTQSFLEWIITDRP